MYVAVVEGRAIPEATREVGDVRCLCVNVDGVVGVVV